MPTGSWSAARPAPSCSTGPTTARRRTPPDPVRPPGGRPRSRPTGRLHPTGRRPDDPGVPVPPTRITPAVVPIGSRPGAPPPVGPFPVGPCRVCGDAVPVAGVVCFCCRTVSAQLGLPLVRLVALCEYRVGDRTHRRLRAYKDAGSAEVRTASRRELAMGLARWERAGGPDALGSAPGRAVVDHRPVVAPPRAGPGGGPGRRGAGSGRPARPAPGPRRRTKYIDVLLESRTSAPIWVPRNF